MLRNLLRFCLTSKHLEPRLNYLKHIKNFEIQKKNSRKKRSNFLEFLNRY